MSFPHIDREALVVIGYCHHTRKMFGIRTERLDSRRWVQDWAFPIEPSVASDERFDRNRISGEIIIDSSYPGWPLLWCHWMVQMRQVRQSCLS